MMINGVVVRFIAAVVAAVFVIGIWASTGNPDLTVLRFLSVAVLIATLLLALWNSVLWHWRPIQHLPRVDRDLRGTWEAELESFWINPKTGAHPPIKTVYFVIRQTSSTISVTLISNESKSKSSTARLILEDGSYTLHYLYTNEPEQAHRSHSPIHHGSGVLTVVGLPAKRINGAYWTDRDSKGNLTLSRRSKKFGEDFQDCVDLFASQAS